MYFPPCQCLMRIVFVNVLKSVISPSTLLSGPELWFNTRRVSCCCCYCYCCTITSTCTYSQNPTNTHIHVRAAIPDMCARLLSAPENCISSFKWKWVNDNGGRHPLHNWKLLCSISVSTVKYVHIEILDCMRNISSYAMAQCMWVPEKVSITLHAPQPMK